MPATTCIHPNDLNIDRLMKVSGNQPKIHSGESLLVKVKRDRAELTNSFMPLLLKLVPRYPNLASGITWDQVQEQFRLNLGQDRCKLLLADNVKDAEKALKDAHARLAKFDQQTNLNPPTTQQQEEAQVAQMQGFAKK